ncbi:unnamed protein product [Symbiodinium sp. CCMP2456]|nr:unnamed protein product [Symbiodinium sp. CCMP2456]
MSKQWRRNGGQSQGGPSYWKGSWSRRDSGFPSCDPGRNQMSWERGQPSATETTGPVSMVQMIQDALNKTRKCEQKVATLTRAKEDRAKLWDRYEADLQKSYAREFNKFHRDLQRIDEDLVRATAAQEESRMELLQVHAGRAPKETEQHRARLDELLAESRGEYASQEAQDVLDRAMRASMAHPTRPRERKAADAQHRWDMYLPLGQLRQDWTVEAVPTTLTMAEAPPTDYTGSGLPHSAGPYQASPGSLYSKVKPLSPSTRPGPYEAGSDPGTASTAVTVADRLQMRRAMTPFGGGQTTTTGIIPPVYPGKPPTTAVIDDDHSGEPESETDTKKNDGDELT